MPIKTIIDADSKSPLKIWPVKIWTDQIEDSARVQIENMAQMPFIHKHIAIMADVHAGIGATIGSVIPTVGAVIPSAVGVDIGCGMCAVPTNLKAEDLPEDLKKIRLEIENAIPVGFNAYPDDRHLTSEENNRIAPSCRIKEIFDRYKVVPGQQDYWRQLGTLGGGNHFIELCLDEAGTVWIMLHSGSRGIGNKIGNRFIEIAKQDMEKQSIHLPDKDLAYLKEGSQHFDDYVAVVEWAQRYAAMNRRIMLRRIVTALKKHFPQIIADIEHRAIQCHHNYISREYHFGVDCIITRKGAVRARKGDFGIIPGSMGTKSYIVEGLGNAESFFSCSHGAGRKMSRQAAKRAFTVQDQIRATEGVECKKDKSVIDEIPMAYKSIDEVMENQRDLVKPLHTLKQVVCIKG